MFAVVLQLLGGGGVAEEEGERAEHVLARGRKRLGGRKLVTVGHRS